MSMHVRVSITYNRLPCLPGRLLLPFYSIFYLQRFLKPQGLTTFISFIPTYSSNSSSRGTRSQKKMTMAEAGLKLDYKKTKTRAKTY